MTIAVAFYTRFKSSGAAAIFSNSKMAMAVCMTVLPMTLYLIFQKQMIGGTKFVGISNYIRLFHDQQFWSSVGRVALFT